MRLKFLGTAAAECFPAIFCNCKFCQQARKLGGKNVRSRSQTLINDDMLIDFPPDTFYHFTQNNIEGDLIKYILLTHNHRDHLYVDDFFSRHGCYAHNLRVPTVKIIGSKTTLSSFAQPIENVEFVTIKEYETITLDGYTITALPARHHINNGALIYIIKGEKTILYAHDTGYFYDEVFDYIGKSGLTFDMATFDCTNVDIPIDDNGTHMGFANIERVIKRLCDLGAITDKTVKYVNHFSHNGNPIHDILEDRAKTYGLNVSYDGCNVEF